MDTGFWILLAVMLSSFLTGIVIFFLRQENHAAREMLNLAGAAIKVVLVAFMMWAYFNGQNFEIRFPIALGFDFLLKVDSLSLLFVSMSAVLWLFTTVYAIGYMKGYDNQSRFFGFFSMCVTASVGVALAGNLITFFIFYELLTLSTYPLVVHKGDRDALTGGRTYLWYTLTGGSVMFVGVVWLNTLTGPVEFLSGGFLSGFLLTHNADLIIIFVLLMAGLGVKAALFPLHGWLPVAMVAPAPVSALLHAVAVVKAGAYGIIRVVYDVYGPDLAMQIGVLTPLAVLAGFTIIYASLRAIVQDDIKAMLAYSTISQLSYIVIGVATTGIIATVGALMHLVHHGFMKITLFFCAGSIEKTFGIRSIRKMDGIGYRSPLMMAAFTLAAFGLIGIPPLAGFPGKWYLSIGGLQGGNGWIIAVMLGSSILNCIYFLPVIYRAWFKTPENLPPKKRHGNLLETEARLLVPALLTGFIILLFGVFAASEYSPMALAYQIARALYP